MKIGGRKDDEGKLRFDLIPGNALEEVVRVYTYGAARYDDWNWRKGMKWSRMYAALLRHLWKFWWDRKRWDDESHCHHLASVVFCALSLMEYDMEGIGDDDRVTSTHRTSVSPPTPASSSPPPSTTNTDADPPAPIGLRELVDQVDHYRRGTFSPR